MRVISQQGGGQMQIEKIYLDMDGVLADFSRGIEELCLIPAMEQGEQTEDQDKEMWNAVKECEHFYDRLEPIPGALELFEEIYARFGDKVEILTGIPKPKRGIITAGEDKTNWAHRLLNSNLKVNIVYREEKKYFVKGKGCILIDDYDKNIKEWEDNGGTGILFTSAWDVMEQINNVGGVV